MALAMCNQGHPDPAILLFDRAARWDREHSGGVGLAIWSLAETLRSLGRYDEAVASYRRVREFPKAGPDDLRKADAEIKLTEADRDFHAAASKEALGETRGPTSTTKTAGTKGAASAAADTAQLAPSLTSKPRGLSAISTNGSSRSASCPTARGS